MARQAAPVISAGWLGHQSGPKVGGAGLPPKLLEPRQVGGGVADGVQVGSCHTQLQAAFGAGLLAVSGGSGRLDLERHAEPATTGQIVVNNKIFFGSILPRERLWLQAA